MSTALSVVDTEHLCCTLDEEALYQRLFDRSYFTSIQSDAFFKDAISRMTIVTHIGSMGKRWLCSVRDPGDKPSNDLSGMRQTGRVVCVDPQQARTKMVLSETGYIACFHPKLDDVQLAQAWEILPKTGRFYATVRLLSFAPAAHYDTMHKATIFVWLSSQVTALVEEEDNPDLQSPSIE